MVDFIVGCGNLFGSINNALMTQDFFMFLFGFIVLISGVEFFREARRTFK